MEGHPTQGQQRQNNLFSTERNYTEWKSNFHGPAVGSLIQKSKEWQDSTVAIKVQKKELYAKFKKEKVTSWNECCLPGILLLPWEGSQETVKTDMAEHTGAITGEFFSVGGPVRRSSGQWPATARKHPDSILQDQLVFSDRGWVL